MAAPATYPVRVDAHLEPPLSRWLWLVKWFLAIPHYIVLAFLWVAFAILSALAFFTILFTGRYPRGIFEFNVGVMRWSWRVAYYTYGALGTDRYPPFTLDEVPEYPTHLAIAYPEHLSRGLVLVKWWLLAIPHYLVVGLLIGSAWVLDEWVWPVGGLIGVLVVIAAFALAFTGRYPEPLFDLILGLNRWVLRVAAYAGLMTDEYPPFRLDMGGDEPRGALTVPAPPAEPGPPSPAPPGGWTGGRIVATVVGALLVLSSLGILTAGGAALWLDRVQRDDAGYVTTGEQRYTTPTYAIASDDIDLEIGGASVTRRFLGDLRLRVTAADPATPIFVGIARSDDAEAYLGRAERAVARDFTDGSDIRTVPGGAPPTRPGQQDFWVTSSSGTSTQTIFWPIRSGSWTIVVMDARARRGVDVSSDAGATLPALPWLAAGLLVGGAVVLVAGVLLVVIPTVRAGRPRTAPMTRGSERSER